MIIAFPSRRTLQSRIARRKRLPVTPLFVTLAAITQTPENTVTLSSVIATLRGHITPNSFICRSCKETPGVGYPFPTRAALRTRRNSRKPSPLNHLLHDFRTPPGGGYPTSPAIAALPHLCHNLSSYQRRKLFQRCGARIAAKP
jgi:hypothetical protein